jgi:CheY-like chemotaxis protein
MKPGALEETQAAQTGTPLRALILEDSQDDLELLLLHLRHSGFDVNATQVEKKDEFHTALCNGNYDVVFADYHLPSWTGIEAVGELRKLGKDIPFLLVTGTLGEEAAVECIKQGANDYVLKEHLSRLPGALSRALSEKALRDERSKAEEALRLSEARNRDLIENSVYGIFRLSPNGEFLDANPALLRILGCLGPEELKELNLGRDVFRFPEQYAQFMAICRERGQVHGSGMAAPRWRPRYGAASYPRVIGRKECPRIGSHGRRCDGISRAGATIAPGAKI